MERGALVAETVLAGGELAEVLRGLGDNVVKELEDDATRRGVVDGDIELRVGREKSKRRRSHVAPDALKGRTDVSITIQTRPPSVQGLVRGRETHENVRHGDGG